MRILGDIEKILAKIILKDPEGWDPEHDQFNLPFTVELKENFHVHWQDMRIEMMPDDFENFAKAIHDAYEKWKSDGKPKKLESMKRYGWWPGEEGFDFHLQRDRRYNKNNKLCHHFKKFPRTESGKLNFDSVIQIELQRNKQYHIHYKNLRIELGKNRVKQMAKALQDTVDDIK